MTAIELASVTVVYDGARALNEVTHRIRSGSWLALIGPNGAGKTSLLRAIAGLVPYSGDVRLAGAAASVLGRRRLAQLVAYVPQRPQVPGSMTVTDYVLMGRTPYIPYFWTEGRRDLDVVAEVIERLQLTRLANRTLGSLSGGEAQRAVLGRALAQEAPVLLLDEPTAALDVGHQQKVLELIDQLRFEHELTVISAMHDLTLAGQFAEQLVLLDGGRAVATGTARIVLTENTIRLHYGASVRVLEDPQGGIVVLPTRPGRGSPAVEETPA